MGHEEESICPKGPWLGATAEPSKGTPSPSSWSRQAGGGRNLYEKCSFHFLVVLSGYLIPAPNYGDMNSRKGYRVEYSPFTGPSSVRWNLSHSHTLTDIYKEQSKKCEIATRGQGKRWDLCSAFWDSPSFSQTAEWQQGGVIRCVGLHSFCAGTVLHWHLSALSLSYYK